MFLKVIGEKVRKDHGKTRVLKPKNMYGNFPVSHTPNLCILSYIHVRKLYFYSSALEMFQKI